MSFQEVEATSRLVYHDAVLAIIVSSFQGLAFLSRLVYHHEASFADSAAVWPRDPFEHIRGDTGGTAVGSPDADRATAGPGSSHGGNSQDWFLSSWHCFLFSALFDKMDLHRFSVAGLPLDGG